MSFEIELFAEGVDCHVEVGCGDRCPQAVQIDELPDQLPCKLPCSFFLAHFNDLLQAKATLTRAQDPEPGRATAVLVWQHLALYRTSNQDQKSEVELVHATPFIPL